MISLSEFLAEGDNQRLMLSNIITALRKGGLWGTRGLFVQISSKTGFSPAYVGQVLMGKKPLTAAFVTKISEHIGIAVPCIQKARQRGSGVTPGRVVDLLKKEVSEKSILAVSKATGLGLAAISRYSKGIGEPTTATLQKLADYFDVPLAMLRDDSGIPILSYPQLADLLKKTVSAKGQRAVARDSGIALLSIQRYLNGGLPSLDNLRKLTRYFGVKAIIS